MSENDSQPSARDAPKQIDFSRYDPIDNPYIPPTTPDKPPIPPPPQIVQTHQPQYAKYATAVSILIATIGAGFFFTSVYDGSTPDDVPIAYDESSLVDDVSKVLDEPVQKTTTAQPFKRNNFIITPRASYDITAKILSIKSYESAPIDGKIRPYDLFISWGGMSDDSFISQINFKQYNRGTHVTTPEAVEPSFHNFVLSQTANVHLTSANKSILDQFRQLRTGQVIHMTGYLIDITRVNSNDEPTWYAGTSLSRTDFDCENIYVQRIKNL